MTSWRECFESNTVKNIPVDHFLIRALQESSADSAYAANLLPMEQRTATPKVTLTYDALRELLEAIALSRGYKIYNHECFTPFLKDVLKKVAEGEEFDQLRKIKNAAKYYGRRLSPEEASPLINRLEKLRTRVQPLLKPIV